MEMKRRQSKLVGHVTMRNKSESLVTTDKLCRRMVRGRQRDKYLHGSAIWHSKDNAHV